MAAAFLVPGTATGPAFAQAPAAAAESRQQEPPDTATEQGALAAARQSGDRVEVGSLRTETRTVYAEPGGGFVLEQHARPIRVRKDGRWTPVDTTLRRLPDGSVAPVATAVDLRLSGGGQAPMAEVARGAKSLALTWPAALPAPVLDGATGHAAAAGPAARTDDSFTVAAWVQLDALPAADAAAVSQSGTRAGGFSLGYAAQGPRWSFGMADADADGAPVTLTRSDATPFAMEWTHLAGVYDALAKKLRVYVGGQLVTSTEIDHSSTWNSAGPLQLGRTTIDGAFAGHWPGIVDDVRTYQGALSDADVARLAAE